MECIECGTDYTLEDKFCSSCGNSLQDQAEDSGLNIFLKTAIGKKADYYLPRFYKFSEKGIGVSWNWAALFFGCLWLVYRKMWLIAILLLFLNISLKIFQFLFPDAIIVSAFFSLIYLAVLFILFPMYANAIYYRSIKKKVDDAISSNANDNLIIQELEKKGGTCSTWIIVLLVAMLFFYGLSQAIVGSAYQQYLARTQVKEAATLITAHRINLALHHAKYSSFSNFNAEVSSNISTPITGKHVKLISFSGHSENEIAIVAIFKTTEEVDEHIRGKEFRYASLDGGKTWQCGEKISVHELKGVNQVEKKYMPKSCR
jgi:Tfp pilus assembly major pilin PilA